MPATRLVVHKLLRLQRCAVLAAGLGPDPTGFPSAAFGSIQILFDLSVYYWRSMAAAASWLAVPAAGTRRAMAQASVCECLQQVRLRPGTHSAD